MLEELGYRALEAEDGPEGLKLVPSDARVDPLIPDVGLPDGMNGRQVADAARELRPDLPVLFVTGGAENAALSHGHLDPGKQVVTKPSDMAQLKRRIGEMNVDGQDYNGPTSGRPRAARPTDAHPIDCSTLAGIIPSSARYN